MDFNKKLSLILEEPQEIIVSCVESPETKQLFKELYPGRPIYTWRSPWTTEPRTYLYVYINTKEMDQLFADMEKHHRKPLYSDDAYGRVTIPIPKIVQPPTKDDELPDEDKFGDTAMEIIMNDPDYLSFIKQHTIN